jgi:DNA-binding NarL/FixJ family response regulator
MKTIVGGKCGYAGTPAEALSDRELQVLREIGNGFSSREIADKLYLSVKTIEKYRSRIKQKLHIDTARGLLRYAIEWVNLEST